MERAVVAENSGRVENIDVRSFVRSIVVFTRSPVPVALRALVASTFQTRAAQQAEIAALRHQIAVLQRSSPRRLRLKQPDRLLWILLSRLWPGWRRCFTRRRRGSGSDPWEAALMGALCGLAHQDRRVHSQVEQAHCDLNGDIPEYATLGCWCERGRCGGKRRSRSDAAAQQRCRMQNR